MDSQSGTNTLRPFPVSTDSELITKGLKEFDSLSFIPVSDETLTSTAKYTFLDADSISTR